MESGHAQLDLVDLGGQARARLVRYDQAFAGQVVHGVDHEERVALRPIVDERRQLARKTMRGEPHRQVFRNRLLVQVLEGQLFTLLLGGSSCLTAFSGCPLAMSSAGR